jgi:hypothetical protein
MRLIYPFKLILIATYAMGVFLTTMCSMKENDSEVFYHNAKNLA